MDIQSIVPLDENSLLERARANTGLSNFGSDPWHEPFQILIKALDQESELNLMGRLMTRSDLLLFLEARLRIEEAYRQHPEIADEEIRSPLFIIGQGRTGTSELLHVLASDPNNRAMLNWEVTFPTLYTERASQGPEPCIEKTSRLQSQYERVTPETRGLHDYGGDVPCENVYMHCLCFRNAGYINAHAGQVPSYVTYMHSQDPVLAYEYEKRVLRMLQWKAPRKQWLFKSPYALLELPSVLKAYPDVRFIWTHRDPIKSLASIVNLMGTLYWVRSDHPFVGGAAKPFEDASLVAGMFVSLVLALAVFIVSTQTAAAAPPSDNGGLRLKDGQGGQMSAPLLFTDVHMDITGMTVRVQVKQRFANPTAEWREGVYVFPLPERAAVDHLHMQIGERVIEGLIKERSEARRTYEVAKTDGRKTTLVEQERPNMFTTSVANIGPNEEIVVAIEYQETLRYDDGSFNLRFPLAITPRYIPGAALADSSTSGTTGGFGWAAATQQVLDAARITPPLANRQEGYVNPVTITNRAPASRAAGTPPHFVLKALQRSVRHPAPIRAPTGEAEPQELAFPRPLHCALGFIDFEFQNPRQILRHTGHHPLPRFLTAYIQVAIVRVARKAMPAPFQFPIQLIE